MGYGEVSSEYSYQSASLIFAYALALFLAGWGSLVAVRRIAWKPRLPYPTGVYLFPLDLVDAKGPVLKVYPVALLTGIQSTHHHYNGAYTGTSVALTYQGGGHYSFMFKARALAEQALATFREAQGVLHRAAQAGDNRTLQQHDVFFECVMDGTWDRFGPTAPPTPVPAPVDAPAAHEPEPPPLFRRAGLAALAGAAVVAAPLWFARNRVSDEGRFDQVRARTASAGVCRLYLDVGGTHADEVRARYLPMAELREAEAHGTVTALRTYLQQNPRSPVAGEARADIHRHFERVQQVYTQQAATSDPRLLPFMVNMLQFMEAHGSPPVQVRFAPPSTEALNRVDALLQSDGMRRVGRPVAPIAGQFDEGSSLPREQTITRSLQTAFGVVFPGDILRLVDGGRLVAGAAAQSPDVATFDVSYTVVPSGSFYTSDRRPRAFVGIVVAFQVSMRVPGAMAPYAFDVTVQPPEHFTVERGRDAGGEPPDTLVYDVMAERAFDQLSDRFRGVFFRPGSPGYNGGSQAGTPAAPADPAPPAPAGPAPVSQPDPPTAPSAPAEPTRHGRRSHHRPK